MVSYLLSALAGFKMKLSCLIQESVYIKLKDYENLKGVKVSLSDFERVNESVSQLRVL